MSTWAVCLLGWLYVYSIPDSFSATAKVYVDTNSALMRYLDKLAVNTNMLSKVEMVTRAMLSRPQLERVARETDLHLRAASQSQLDTIVDRLMDDVEIVNDERREPNLYEIRYSDVEPAIARGVVAALLDIFVEDSLGEDREGSRNAQEFLRVEKEKVASELRESELRLAQFKKDNVGRLPEQGADYYQRLQSEMTLLEKTQSDIRLATRKRDTIHEQMRGNASIADLADSVDADLKVRLPEYEKRLEELQLKYTDLHPDVIAVKSTIEQLKQRQADRMEEIRSVAGIGVGPATDNPLYQSLQVDLSQIDVELAALEETESSQRRKVAKLTELIDVLPEVEAELKRLTRDYGAKQVRYEELLRRLEVAELTEAAGQSENIKFRIIEPPRLPARPSAPNRQLLLAGMLFLGLAGGAVAGFAGNHLSPVIQTVSEIRALVDVPVLGQVSQVETSGAASARRAQLGLFAISIVSLLLTFGLVFSFADAGSQMLRLALT